MLTIEELDRAISNFEQRFTYMGLPISETTADEIMQSGKTALAALRNERERANGCDWCMTADGRPRLILSTAGTVKYCEFCGRSITERSESNG